MARSIATKKDKQKVCKFCGMPVVGFHFDGFVVRFACGAKEVNNPGRASLGFRSPACKVIEVLGKGGLNLPKLESKQLEFQFPDTKPKIKAETKVKSKVKVTKLV